MYNLHHPVSKPTDQQVSLKCCILREMRTSHGAFGAVAEWSGFVSGNRVHAPSATPMLSSKLSTWPSPAS